jgi:hypothetical protein
MDEHEDKLGIPALMGVRAAVLKTSTPARPLYRMGRYLFVCDLTRLWDR